MNVVYLHQYFNTPEMSGGVRSYDIAKHLVNCGHSVDMVTTSRVNVDKVGWSYTNEDGINVHWFSLFYSNQLSYIKRLFAFFSFAYHGSKKGSELQGDIVFATSTPLTIAIPALYISWKLKIPMVFEVRDLWPDVPIAVGVIKNPIIKYLAKALEKYTYKKAAAVIALSHGMKDGVVAAGCMEDNVAVIPNFSNRSLFDKDLLGNNFRSERDWLKSSPLLVYTGTFGMINGVDYLVDIAEQLLLLNSVAKILLVGDGKKYEDVVAYAADKGVLNVNLFVEDSVKKTELPQLLAAADLASNIVIDVPAVWNNSANKFFDALASGTPVLINGGGWQADLIEQEDAGVVTFGLSIKLSAMKIDAFLHDKERVTKASKNALVLSEKYFDKDDLVEMVEKVLLSVIDNNGWRASEIGLQHF